MGSGVVTKQVPSGGLGPGLAAGRIYVERGVTIVWPSVRHFGNLNSQYVDCIGHVSFGKPVKCACVVVCTETTHTET